MAISSPFPASQPSPSHYTTEDKVKAGLTAFFSIAEEWELSVEEQRALLGAPSRTTFYEWKKNKSGNVSRDTLDRLSYVVGIYKALRTLFSQAAASQWLRTPNQDPLFANRSPLQYLLGGSLVALSDVRRYLDWARG